LAGILYELQVIAAILTILIASITLIGRLTPQGRAFWHSIRERWNLFKDRRATRIECDECGRKFEPNWQNEGILFLDEYSVCPFCGAKNKREEIIEEEADENSQA
jgi:hypothetical protein